METCIGLAASLLLAHLLALVFDIGGFGSQLEGARLGFAPVLSLTVLIVIGVHAVGILILGGYINNR